MENYVIGKWREKVDKEIENNESSNWVVVKFKSTWECLLLSSVSRVHHPAPHTTGGCSAKSRVVGLQVHNDIM